MGSNGPPRHFLRGLPWAFMATAMPQPSPDCHGLLSQWQRHSSRMSPSYALEWTAALLLWRCHTALLMPGTVMARPGAVGYPRSRHSTALPVSRECLRTQSGTPPMGTCHDSAVKPHERPWQCHDTARKSTPKVMIAQKIHETSWAHMSSHCMALPFESTTVPWQQCHVFFVFSPSHLSYTNLLGGNVGTVWYS